MGKPNFSDEFKRDAVVQITERGYPVAEVSERLGVSPHSLYAWKKQFSKVASGDANKDAEIRQLKRELARVTEERDILKKGDIILAVPTRIGYPKCMSSALPAPHFHNEEAAYAYVEARVWPQGPVCPHCGGVERIGKMGGTSTRIGAYKCYQCRKPFTVKVGTIFEASKVAMHLWLQAMYLIAGSKKGMSSNQLHRILGVTLKTAWFMSHRIREAMRSGDLTPFGSDGGIVEIDETFIGHDRTIKPEGEKKGRGYAHKHKVLSLVDRSTGRQRSMVVDSLKAADLTPILIDNIAQEAHVMTDEASYYRHLDQHFASHHFTRHGAGQYVDYANPTIHTNTIEGAFSIFKRGMKGTYQHCAKKHLHRYVAEFEFRYTNRIATGFNDADRADEMLRGVVGKRLTYETTRIGA